jgi:hypothetical protein
MDKLSPLDLPQARVNRLPGRRLGRIFALRRRWIGRSELAALALAVGITALMGGVLAGFGAANPEGVAIRPVSSAAPEQKPATLSLSRQDCAYASRAVKMCRQEWERNSHVADPVTWDVEEGWVASHCSVSPGCVDYVNPYIQDEDELD